MARNKYGSRKVVLLDGTTFDSQKEFNRWCELKLMERHGRISDLRRQMTYLLIPCQYEPDKIGVRGGVKRGNLLEREVSYVADFVYTQDGNTVVEDTKGFKTKDYIIKRKLMLYIHGIRIKEV